MVRQWFIGGVLLVITLVLLWDFVSKAVLYSPLAEVQGIETVSPERPAEHAGFKPAWGPEILAQNLFSEQRSAPPPAPEPQPQPMPAEPPVVRPPKPNLTLTGIIVNTPGRPAALIRKNGGQAVSLREGDAYEGVKVVEIKDRNVTLIWYGETFELSLTSVEPVTR